MGHKRTIFNSEFPDGIEVAFTAKEETDYEARVVKAAGDHDAFTTKIEKQKENKASGNQKLKDLGLTDDEIAALTN